MTTLFHCLHSILVLPILVITTSSSGTLAVAFTPEGGGMRGRGGMGARMCIGDGMREGEGVVFHNDLHCLHSILPALPI